VKKHSLFSIPFPSTSVVDEPVYLDRSNLSLLWLTGETDDDRVVRSEILFVRPRALRHRGESYCTPWHIEDAYDTVVEVDDSEWADELGRVALAARKHSFVLRHFMIYLDSFGCLEVLAESVELRNVWSTDEDFRGFDPLKLELPPRLGGRILS